jgi:hypothetical protein
MPVANLALATVAGENAAKAAFERIASGMADQNELSRAYESLATGSSLDDYTELDAAVTGFHRAIQKRLEATVCRSAQ